ncbi:translational activator [Aureobasidium pullulans]|uniref:eIF-2-alpha kinase activator GCN1 n=1 Tax=Aureobasidium pullulans TaxID=5580 RepID=A0A4S8W1U8_AURPU|nr:translational activator [Aureobasidium pullulans]
MAEGEVNGEQTLDAGRLRQVALSSSTKKRSTELLSLHDKIVSKEYPIDQIPNALNVLFDTYPLYVDTQSRQAAEQCLVAIFSTADTEPHVSTFISAVETETKKGSLAPANAFVLIRWCALFLQQFALQRPLWDTWGLKIVHALVRATYTFESSNPRHSTHQTVLRVTRRAFRKLFSSDFGDEALNQSVSALTVKAAAPTPQNALVLGIIAGVSARLPKRATTFETKKSDYNAFFLREFIGSRTVLPQFIANALVDYFNSFVTLEDLKKDIIPAIEKALLRSPEIVLNDLVTPMINALPKDLDLSDILANNLLKPLVSSAKSSNATIRAGALRTFSATARRSHDDKLIEKVLGEILTPLKTGKVPSADQKIIFAQMLAALNSSEALAASIPQDLAPVAAKEPNEAAASAEIAALSKHLKFGLEKGVAVNAAVTDAYVKGVAEKRLPFRKLWTLSIAEIVWSLEGEVLKQPEVAGLVDAVVGKMIDSFNEVVSNPVVATQNGQVTIACAVTALSLAKVPQLAELKNASVLKKASILDRAIALEPKPSFLLNTRVYTKLTSHEDLVWLTRALAATSSGIASSQPEIQDAWAQTFIYLIVASGLPATARSETIASLRTAYLAQPEAVGKTVTDALSHWAADVELETKESAAVLAKTGRQELYKVVRCICLTKEEVAAGQATIEQAVLDHQLVNLLILCRPELTPRSSWIETCLKTGTDPGELVKRNTSKCMDQIIRVSEDKLLATIPAFQLAAFQATADLAFVAPEDLTSVILDQICSDLDPKLLQDVGPTEAAIFRTPEGTAFIDVLAKQTQAQAPSKNSKDYDTYKWEQELRDSLAQKKGTTKKLTADEQTKVNAQLAKEAEIRSHVTSVVAKLRRGIGMVTGLVTGPPTEAANWFTVTTARLFEVINAGAGLVLGDAAVLAYLECAQKTSSRLGAMRSFVGVAALRAAGLTTLPESMQEEPLGDLITRVLYRLRFLGEQRPLDAVTLSYCLPLAFLVLEQGGVGKSEEEEAQEQIILAAEFLSFHADTCSEPRLARKEVLSVLVSSLQAYQQHFRLFKDCFTDVCRSVAPNATEAETDVVVKATIVPESSVREVALQAISAEFELSGKDFYDEIFLATHDDVQENVELAHEIWVENELKTSPESATSILEYLASHDIQLRRAAARSLAALVQEHSSISETVISNLQDTYKEDAKPRAPQRDKYGMPIKMDLSDPWQSRQGIALAFNQLTPTYGSEQLVPLMQFMVAEGPLGDKSASVRDSMLDATTAIIAAKGNLQVETLMKLFESTLEGGSGSQTQDAVNEAVVILYGALARHLKAGDSRVPKVVQRLLTTLNTPSESVQYAVAQCLPPLVQASNKEAGQYVQQMMDTVLTAKKYAAKRGAAYGLAGIVKGRGVSALREFRIMSNLVSAIEDKKDPYKRQGAFLAYELMSLILGRVFEPYVIQVVPQLLSGFGDAIVDVREACLDAAKTCFASLSSYGVKQVLPTLLEGLDEQQWRSKKGACDSLGAMAYLDPEQLAVSLPEIIPPLTDVLNDSHKEVRASANRSLQRFGDVISNPEIKSQVDIILKALSDPTKYTDDALDALIKVNFIHYLDAPSLALVVRVLERGLGDRSATKKKASQIIGSLAHLTERKDLITHLPILVAGLRVAIVDPVPTTRATASKALGSTIEKLGEDAMPDLIPSLMATLKSDTGAGDRLGSAQALSEVLAGLGTSRLEETLPTILQNISSSKPAVREGFMSLFIYLPACFGNSFSNYLSKIIPPILSGLADDIDTIRETALRAGRLLVKNFATRAIDLLLPELERGLADDSYRIRLSSVELVGDLLFNLSGISGTAEQEEAEEGANEAGQSLLEVLGEEKRNKVLSALYICRCDTSGLVRTASINVWKALVASPRTLRELIPTLTQLLIHRLASSNMEQKEIAGNALGELIRKAGEGVLSTLLPTLEQGLQTTDVDAKQGICIALRELIASASPDSLEDHEKTLVSVVRIALVDGDEDVREAAAEAFDSLQKVLGKRAIDQVLPYLLNLLRSDEDADNALSALLTLLTEQTRSNVILPNLLPTLLTPPITAFNAKALASLAQVASSAMTRRLPNILNALMDSVLGTKDEELRADLENSFDAVLLSIDEFDGLNTAMSAMLALTKHEDHHRRARADMHLAKFFKTTDLDISRYYPDLIRTLLISFDDSDAEVVKAAWTALSALTGRLRKEEMESLVFSTRQTLNQVGVAGHSLPGFSLPKGINAILPIFLQGLMNGSAEQRTAAALAISDIIDRTSADALKPFVTQITGPLIRVVSERSVEVKAAILFTLNNLLEKIPAFLKPFLPQLQRTFAKSLADTSSEILRIRAAKALGTLITLTPRIDPLIAELITGSKTADAGVRNAMLKALYDVVVKCGSSMNEASRTGILSLIDSDTGDSDEASAITNARLLGALIKVLPEDVAGGLVKARVLTPDHTYSSVLALNSILAEAPGSLTGPFADVLPSTICQGISSSQPAIADNCVLASGKYLLTPTSDTSFEPVKQIMEALAAAAAPGKPVDTRRLALVVLRTVSREQNDLIRPHLALLTPAVFGSVRDMVIPVKLAAEAAFLAMFSVVEEEDAIFAKYMAGPGAELAPGPKRSIQDYFKRIATRLGAQARERREAEGGQGGLGLSSDEQEDMKEVWSVGKVDVESGAFKDE